MGRKKTGFNKTEYDKYYKKELVKRYTITLNKIKDKNIVEHLDSKKLYSKYIKDLIKKDMEG